MILQAHRERFTCIKTCSFSALTQFICVHPIYSTALDAERTLSRDPHVCERVYQPIETNHGKLRQRFSLGPEIRNILDSLTILCNTRYNTPQKRKT